MWLRFLSMCDHILPTRQAFYYLPGTEQDVPEEWALPWIAGQKAIEIAGPGQPHFDDPMIPQTLGDAPLTVACVHKLGGVYDGKDYVGRLARGVARNMTVPHRFVCLSDDPEPVEGVEKIPLLHAWPRSWAKVELYRPGLFSGPVLYIDLDTVICGSLDDLASATDPVLATWDLQRGWINSSLLRWSVDLSPVYKAMVDDTDAVIKRYEAGGLWGDQGLLQDTLTEQHIQWRWVQEVCREQVIWVVPDVRGLPPPAGTRVTMWYGNPKPHEIKTQWMDRNWF